MNKHNRRLYADSVLSVDKLGSLELKQMTVEGKQHERYFLSNKDTPEWINYFVDTEPTWGRTWDEAKETAI